MLPWDALLALASGLLLTDVSADADGPAKGLPACDAQGQNPPVRGEMRAWELEGGPQPAYPESSELWEFALESGCRYPLWESQDSARCLRGAWVVFAGASNANIWTSQLSNSLVPGAIVPNQHNFSIDGVFTQLIDIIIEDGKVVYRNVVVDSRVQEDYTATGKKPPLSLRNGAHSRERDQRVLPDVFAQINRAPAYSKNAIRVTHFVAEFWDTLPLITEAVQKDKGWAAADVAMVASLGLWYRNAFKCRYDGCTRPAYSDLTADELHATYRDDMQKALSKVEGFCNGRSSRMGCTLTSIEHCPKMKIPIWGKLRDDMEAVLRENVTSKAFRYVDLWTLTGQIPEACLEGHQSPMSAQLTMQVLLGGMCSSTYASKGSLAAFHGPSCRAAYLNHECPPYELHDMGFVFPWDCANAQSCELEAVAQKGMRLVRITDKSTSGTVSLAAARSARGTAQSVAQRQRLPQMLLVGLTSFALVAMVSGVCRYRRRSPTHWKRPYAKVDDDGLATVALAQPGGSPTQQT